MYFLALLEASSKGTKLLSNSLIISLTLFKFWLVLSSFLKASSFLLLYFNTPAASSNIILLSSGLLDNISSILPWLIILKLSLAVPLSVKSSVISFNLTFSLFI